MVPFESYIPFSNLLILVTTALALTVCAKPTTCTYTYGHCHHNIRPDATLRSQNKVFVIRMQCRFSRRLVLVAAAAFSLHRTSQQLDLGWRHAVTWCCRIWRHRRGRRCRSTGTASFRLPASRWSSVGVRYRSGMSSSTVSYLYNEFTCPIYGNSPVQWAGIAAV